MNWEDLHTKFLKMEDDLNLFELRINNVKVWELIRFHVFTMITCKPKNQIDLPSSKRFNFSRLKLLFSSVLKLSWNPLLASESDFLFISCSRRMLEKDGLWWDIYTDPIIEKMSTPPVVLESHYMTDHYSPVKTPGLRYLDFFDFITYLMRILKLVKVQYSSNEKKLLRNLRQKIFDVFEVKINIEELIQRTLEERKARLPLYRLMLRKTQPNLVVLAQGYEWETMIEACKSLGIKTVELQHGIIYPSHVAYSFPGKSRKKDLFADYLLLWGEHWKSSIEYPISPHNLICAGFPYLDLKKEQSYSIDEKKDILFISQDIVGKTLSKYAIALSKDPEIHYRILYKLHPFERLGWKANYPDLISSKVVVIDQQNAKLHDLLAGSIIQVGVCSTALYEGLVFGLNTYLVDEPCIEIMAPLLESGLAKKVSSPDELIECVKEREEIRSQSIEHFFRSDALHNIVVFLEKLNKYLKNKKGATKSIS